jgi:hypothetical protein
MQKAASKMPKVALNQKQRTLVIAALGLIIITVIFGLLNKPERSVASYCKVFKQENAKLPKPSNSTGNAYGVAGLVSSSSNPHSFAQAFSKLEKVAPENIRHDVGTLKAVFEKIDSDPSQELTAGISGLSAESNVKKWTSDNCE